jgi:hypothetical protein
MKPKAIVIHLLLSILFFSSCRKEKESALPPGPPAEDTPILAINLNDAYMPATKIDSAIAVWETNGSKKEIKLTIEDRKLTTNLKQLSEGTGKLTLKLFSKIKFGTHYSSQWILEKEMAIDHNKSSLFSAPGNFNDMLWSPRAVLKDGVSRVAVVALRPDDPYFFIEDVPDGLEKIIVYRGYWNTIGGVRNIAGREWECTTGCINSGGDIENKDFFSFLPSQIGNRAWNHIEIIILYEESNGWAYILDLNHNL